MSPINVNPPPFSALQSDVGDAAGTTGGAAAATPRDPLSVVDSTVPGAGGGRGGGFDEDDVVADRCGATADGTTPSGALE
mmetsp:Transcript_18649/g.21453  ORF Transcript_18649/g.21453 Transcript_18649/m.21453 type:complete len:80 (-) Transcript_18649:537-776(-)